MQVHLKTGQAAAFILDENSYISVFVLKCLNYWSPRVKLSSYEITDS